MEIFFAELLTIGKPASQSHIVDYGSAEWPKFLGGSLQMWPLSHSATQPLSHSATQPLNSWGLGRMAESTRKNLLFGTAALLSLLAGISGTVAFVSYPISANRATLTPAGISAFDVTEEFPPVIVDGQTSYSCDFRVRNPTTAPVHLLKVHCGCDCKTKELDNLLLAPAEETVLSVTTSLTPRPGFLPIVCTIETDCPERPVWTHSIRLPVYPRIYVDPGRVLLGSLEPDQVVERNFTLETFGIAGDAHYEFEPVTTEQTSVAASQTTHEEVLAGGVVHRKTPLRLVFRAPADPGQGRELVPIARNVESAQVFELECSWFVSAPIEMAPRSGAFFGRIDDQQPRTRIVILRSESAFRIVGVKPTAEEAVSVEYSESQAEKHTIKLTLHPESVHGAATGEIVVMVDHPLQQEIRIPYAAFRHSLTDGR